MYKKNPKQCAFYINIQDRKQKPAIKGRFYICHAALHSKPNFTLAGNPNP